MKTKLSRHTKQIITKLTLFALTTTPAYAALPPNSGVVLDSVKPPTVQQPLQPSADIIVKNQDPVSQEGGEKIPVNAFRISGEPPVPAQELLTLIQNEAGKELTLGELSALADKLTQHLRGQGYLVAFAYIPAQEIKDGLVEISVVPGKYGDIKISGDGHLRHNRLKDMLFAAKPGMLITRAPLERALLLLSDLNGVSVKATLLPGTVAGVADLVLEVTDTTKIGGVLYADNWGNRYTGTTRYGTQMAINNVSETGDVFQLGGLTTGQGINNYNFGYSTNWGNDGAKIEVKYSRVDYTLGDTFADLGATGQAEVSSYGISYPLVRRRDFSLYSTLTYDRKGLRDDIANSGSYSPRTSKLWSLALAGNFSDTWLGGSNNAFTLTHYRGKLRFQDAAALAADAASAKTDGDFTKTVLTWQRQQYVAKNLTFNMNFTGQLASKNLDSSEKLYLGGADGVRAFAQGEASGDQGYKLTGELRWLLPGLSTTKDSLYVNGFYDYGSVMINQQPYSTGTNRRSLMGTGLGLLWIRPSDFSIRLDYAWKVGQEASASNDNNKSGRLWLQGVKYF